ncbi:AraC family transcriptional regulator [Rhizobium sp. P38BS-XIX]|nr:AraC family transcriptional regulator [Rhizobium sp. P38BS-XIX]
MDPLTSIISVLKPATVVSKKITASGRWGVQYDAYEAPSFAIVIEGRCLLSLDGAPPFELSRGDFVLIPRMPAFCLTSDPDAMLLKGVPSADAVHHGDQDSAPDFQMLGGSFEVGQLNKALLQPLLPSVIHVWASETDTSRLARTIDLIVDESAADRPGRDMIVRSLLEVVLIEALRSAFLGANSLDPGLFAGMRDPGIARSLHAMHGEPSRAWTVVELAALAGMSRSSFSDRFSELVGRAPKDYLSNWRMTLAIDALGRNEASLSQIAEEAGYESASAFSTAFRRRIGCSPGAFAKSMRANQLLSR